MLPPSDPLTSSPEQGPTHWSLGLDLLRQNAVHRSSAGDNVQQGRARRVHVRAVAEPELPGEEVDPQDAEDQKQHKHQGEDAEVDAEP